MHAWLGAAAVLALVAQQRVVALLAAPIACACWRLMRRAEHGRSAATTASLFRWLRVCCERAQRLHDCSRCSRDARLMALTHTWHTRCCARKQDCLWSVQEVCWCSVLWFARCERAKQGIGQGQCAHSCLLHAQLGSCSHSRRLQLPYKGQHAGSDGSHHHHRTPQEAQHLACTHRCVQIMQIPQAVCSFTLQKVRPTLTPC